MFSDKLIAAIASLSGQFAGEIQVEEEDNFAEVLAETVLDAGRLGMHGHQEAQDEARIHIAAHGWNTVLKEAAKHVCY